MSREIKFRAWEKDKKAFLSESEVDLFSLNDMKYNDPHIFSQFTGLKDKNGKEIYEGDILRVGENLTCEIVYISLNVDDYGDEISCAFHAKVHGHNKIIPLDGYFVKDCKVIGNIYENPQLL